MQNPQPGTKETVALFVTCLVDLFRPSVGFAAVKLLETAGYRVEVPEQQTCCGQPAYNSGDNADAEKLARQVIKTFEPYDHVVMPSGSCAGTIVTQYPDLLRHDPDMHEAARRLANKAWELTRFLTEVAGVEDFRASYAGKATYHDTCSGLRELGVKQQPRQLLSGIQGLQLQEMEDTEVCCGFGGTFCVKFPEISTRMVSDKIENIRNTGADTLLGGDMGCLLNIAGRLKREGIPVRVYHVAEVLAGMTDTPAIGEGEPR